MRVDLNVDDTVLLERLDNPEKRIVFAVVNGINDTLKTGQRAVQLHVQDEFTIRQPFVLRQAAIIKPFANVKQGRPYGEIAVGQRRRLLLAGFEGGELRTPFKGRESVAVPVEARPSPQARIPEELFVQRLGIRKVRAKGKHKAGAGVAFEGKQGTYLIPRKGIFQRLGSGLSRVLYVLARPFRLEKKLEFVDTVVAVARRVFPDNLRRHISESLERRRR